MVFNCLEYDYEDENVLPTTREIFLDLGLFKLDTLASAYVTFFKKYVRAVEGVSLDGKVDRVVKRALKMEFKN